MHTRSRFLAAASHDLRQPLHALGLFIDSLSAASGQAEPALIERIQRAMTSLEEMFDSLLDISRLDVGAVVAHPTDFDVGGMLCDLGEQLEPAARRKGLELHVEAPNCFVESDPVLLARIVRNLLHNAIRYTDHGEVRLRAEEREGQVAIDVIDTGRGIPAARQAEIFDEFTQLDADAAEGPGLGLSIVTRLAKLLGHEVEVHSVEGEGACFTVRVPIASGLPKNEPENDVTDGGVDLRHRRVLVVDDDLEILQAMARLLRSWGCDITLAASLDDVEQSLTLSSPPDVVLADWRLKNGETGTDAIALVREAVGEDVPAALITGDAVPSAPSGLRVARKPLPAMRMRALLIELLGADA